MKTNLLKTTSCSLLAAMLAVSPLAASPIFAEENNTASITFNDQAGHHTYAAYQIFTGTQEGNDGPLGDLHWGNGINVEAFVAALKENHYLGQDVKATDAKAVAAVFNDDNAVQISKLAYAHLNGTGAVIDAQHPTIQVAKGYYLIVDTSEQSKEHTKNEAMLQVTNNIVIDQKWEKPVLTMQVKENKKANGIYNDVADYSIGETIPFSMASAVPHKINHYDTYSFVFHNELAQGLALDRNSIKVYVGNSSTPLPASEYTVTMDPGHEDCDFHVTLNDVKKYESGTPIRVDYNATLTNAAQIGLAGNTTKAFLEFPNHPYYNLEAASALPSEYTGYTAEERAVVFTYQLDITKVDGAELNKHLAGAQFRLSKVRDNQTLYYHRDEAGNPSWVDQEDQATLLESSADPAKLGELSVAGLDDGAYTLTEVKAPDGYNIGEPIKFTLKADTVHDQPWVGDNHAALKSLTLKVTGKSDFVDPNKSVVKMTIVNNKGAILPKTGGSGKTLLYTAGGALVVGGLVLLVARKRRDEE